jgi:hypothetical protein
MSDHPHMTGTRRSFLLGAAMSAAYPMLARAATAPAASKARALPLTDIRLLPSPFLDAVNANLAYLLSLDPERLLHNFRKFAGLAPTTQPYGGWEADTIAGHTLGHYLSALALMHAQTGNETTRTRARYIVGQLGVVQAKQGDGYVAGLLRKRPDGTIVDGKEIFPEIARGDIRVREFDLNGAWSPFYNLHKLFAGLLDVTRCAVATRTHSPSRRALPVTSSARLHRSTMRRCRRCSIASTAASTKVSPSFPRARTSPAGSHSRSASITDACSIR